MLVRETNDCLLVVHHLQAATCSEGDVDGARRSGAAVEAPLGRPARRGKMGCCHAGRKSRLLLMFGMTTAFFLVEIIVGYVTNSMALVADSFHMLSDVISLVIAFLSIKVSNPRTGAGALHGNWI